ncbi:MAG: 3-methyl-2-oxobutanoate hydroxymethyltransferase [Alicyclobacillus sp.]|nr:3-methyl-2-oxobutanoate hydroxymethyltransferase [Alicyclobacillus sp.]
MPRKMTVQTLWKMKQAGQRIAMLTAYDYPTARLLDEAGVHALLVGDSLGMVFQGHETTVKVTLEQMIYHTEMVSRAAQQALVIADLPFLCASLPEGEALRCAGRLMQEGGAGAVKLEGGRAFASLVRRLVQAGIPVMGHLGLTPQSVHALGGFSVQGRTRAAVEQLLDDARALVEAGVFAIVLELIPAEVAARVTRELPIPTIGIGAGPDCDGQVLVFHDFVGYTSGYVPKHNKRYAELADAIRRAAATYIQEVGDGVFPGPEQTVHLKPEEAEALAPLLNATHATDGPPQGGHQA